MSRRAPHDPPSGNTTIASPALSASNDDANSFWLSCESVEREQNEPSCSRKHGRDLDTNLGLAVDREVPRVEEDLFRQSRRKEGRFRPVVQFAVVRKVERQDGDLFRARVVPANGSVPQSRRRDSDRALLHEPLPALRRLLHVPDIAWSHP